MIARRVDDLICWSKIINLAPNHPLATLRKNRIQIIAYDIQNAGRPSQSKLSIARSNIILKLAQPNKAITKLATQI